MDYLEQAVRRPTSALLVSGERALAAEFPTEAQARRVLTTIGHGERTFTSIGRASGDLNPGAVKRSLDVLTARRIVAADVPLSTRPSRETRYRALRSVNLPGPCRFGRLVIAHALGICRVAIRCSATWRSFRLWSWE